MIDFPRHDNTDLLKVENSVKRPEKLSGKPSIGKSIDYVMAWLNGHQTSASDGFLREAATRDLVAYAMEDAPFGKSSFLVKPENVL